MFEKLSSIGQRIYQFIESAVRGGLNRGAVFERVKSIFPGYREEEYLKDWKTLSNAVARWTEIEGYPEEVPIREDFFELTRLPTPKPYMVTVKGKLINVKTGEWTEVRYTIGFDRTPSKKEVVENSMKAFNVRSQTGETDWRFKYDGIERLMRGY